jgi:DNA-directed RNA polymerase
MPSRKRAHEEMAAETTKPEQPQSTVLDRIRNMSEFAALMQYLFFFGKTIKAEETEVEVKHLALIYII